MERVLIAPALLNERHVDSTLAVLPDAGSSRSGAGPFAYHLHGKQSDQGWIGGCNIASVGIDSAPSSQANAQCEHEYTTTSGAAAAIVLDGADSAAPGAVVAQSTVGWGITAHAATNATGSSHIVAPVTQYGTALLHSGRVLVLGARFLLTGWIARWRCRRTAITGRVIVSLRLWVTAILSAIGLLASMSASAGLYKTQFTVGGFFSDRGVPPPTTQVVGWFVWEGASVSSEISRIRDVRLTIDGHSYTAAGVDFANYFGPNFSSVSIFGATNGGALASRTDDFSLRWDPVTLRPSPFYGPFVFSTSRSAEIWTSRSASDFISFSVLPIDFKSLVDGAVTVTTSGPTISARFQPNYNFSLAEAAALGGYDHFNWLQVVIRDPQLPTLADGTRPRVPYIDPPKGGYKYIWTDDRPYYWNEEDSFFSPRRRSGYLLDDHMTADSLHFEDSPRSPYLAGEYTTFVTSLVGVRSAFDWDILNTFTWNTNFNGGDGEVFRVLGADFPFDIAAAVGGVFGVETNVPISDFDPSVRDLLLRATDVSPVPEPPKWLLLLASLLGAAATRRARAVSEHINR